MNLISLEKAAKAYAHRTLLDGVSLGVSAGDRIGVVGRNGAGKSTLLGLLAGRVTPDSGRVAMAAGLRLGYLPQSDQLTGTVGEIVFGLWGPRGGRLPRSEQSPGGPAGGTADAGLAAEQDGSRAPWEADPRARAIMAELLPGVGVDAQAGRLSGGERRRVALASLLVAEPDVLLLDEPTNHLDIEAIDWLGRHLRDRAESRHCAVIVVSHDRWLLDLVCERTWEVDRGQVHSAEGGYSAYVLAEAERERGEEAAERRRRNLARKELAWLQRGAKARTTKAKFRVEAATALIASEPPPRDSVELTRLATARLGKTVIELEGVSVSAGADGRERSLLDRVTWRLAPGERVGIVGVNGSGKTTLLKVLAGEGSPGLHEDGTVIRGKTVRVAHLSQELAELDPDQRVREAVEEIRLRIQVGDRELSAGQLLERLGFTAERQWTRVGDLSGGEQRRVQMLRLLMTEPNVPAARRADQRPGHRDADRVRGPPRRLARHAGGGQSRPLLPGTGDRARGSAARRRQARPLGRRRGRVPAPRAGRPLRRGPQASPGPASPGRSTSCGSTSCGSISLESIIRRHVGRRVRLAAPVGGRRSRRPQGTAAPRTPAGPPLRPRIRAQRRTGRQRHRLRKAHQPRRRPKGRPSRKSRPRRALANRSGRPGPLSEPKGRGAAWTDAPREPKGAGAPWTPSEPKGRGAAWTEERGTSDEGRRHLKSAPEAS